MPFSRNSPRTSQRSTPSSGRARNSSIVISFGGTATTIMPLRVRPSFQSAVQAIRNISILQRSPTIKVLLLRLARARQRPPRLGARVFAILQHLHAVYEYLLHAKRILVRLAVRRFVDDRGWVEDDHIGEVTIFQQAAFVEAEVCGRQVRHLANRF